MALKLFDGVWKVKTKYIVKCHSNIYNSNIYGKRNMHLNFS